jgi:hypothetical protein
VHVCVCVCMYARVPARGHKSATALIVELAADLLTFVKKNL